MENEIISERRSFFYMTPNVIDGMKLSVYAHRLYAHLLRVIGDNDNGSCWQSTRTIAEICCMSIGMVTKAKNELIERKLITVEVCKKETGIYHKTRIMDVWGENKPTLLNEGCSCGEQGRSQSEQGCSCGEIPCSCGERKNTTVINTPIKKIINTPAKTAAENILFPLAKALSDVSGMDIKLNRGRIFATAKKLSGVEATPEKILSEYSTGGVWYAVDWRGKKGQRPTIDQIVATWGTLSKEVVESHEGKRIVIDVNTGAERWI